MDVPFSDIVANSPLGIIFVIAFIYFFVIKDG